MDRGGKQTFDYQLNFIIVGESGVGKSCLVLNFAEQRPRRQHQVTIACEFATRVIPVKQKMMKIQIWDTAGQENFRSITRSYYRNSVAAIIVYDITNKSSFDKVSSWIEEVKQNVHAKVCIFLVGNKIDLEKNREISYDAGYNLAKQHKIKFTETCAFELSTIEPLFRSLAEDVLQKIENKEIDPANEHFGVKVGNKAKESSSDMVELRDSDGEAGEKKKKCCGKG